MTRRYLFVAISAVFLGGCSATANLAEDSAGLSEKDHRIARLMSEMTTARCTRNTYDPASGQAVSGNVRLHAPAAIRKLFVSANTGWYKADAISSGVWDSVYYNDMNHRFICGENGWANNPKLAAIVFAEIKPGQTATSSSQQPSPCIAFRASKRITCQQAIAYDEEQARKRKQKSLESAHAAE